MLFCHSKKNEFMDLRTIDPRGKNAADMHQLLVGTVAPRPIAFVSTISPEGQVNLAPYSFFNVVSTQPAILVFAPVLRGSDGTAKDTLQNVRAVPEVAINVVSYEIVRQMAVTSIQYPPEVDEFTKSGLTPIDSTLIRPYRVKESPVQFECTVREIVSFGDHGGAGQLVICEALRIHVSEHIFDDKDRIDPHRIDLMGRMGRAFYTRASGASIHRIYQPFQELGIGYEALPESVRNSTVLTGNHLGQLASITQVPHPDDLKSLRQEPAILKILHGENAQNQLHQLAQEALAQEDITRAARIVYLADQIA